MSANLLDTDRALDKLAATPISHIIWPSFTRCRRSIKTPFDRILIAPAMAEELTLVTTDGEMGRLPVRDWETPAV